jgi:hypothetical protein
MIRYICILFILSLFHADVLAQQKADILQNRVLYTKYYVGDFMNDTTRWAWELDVVYRRQSELNMGNFWAHPLRYSFRPWIAYQFTKMTRVSFNPIGFYNSAPRYPLASDLNRSMERELRTTLQINNYANYHRFNFTHRLRFESRWRGIDNPEGANHNFRFRYRIRLRTPLNSSYFYKNNTIYLTNYHEIHVEFGRDYGTNYLSQVRNYVGLGYRVWDWTRFELGCLYQYNTRSNNQQVDFSIGPMFYIFFDILSKNQKRYHYSF